MCFYQFTLDEGMSDCFKDWLAKELECLRMRASYAVPEDFPKDDVWNWEVCFFPLFLIPQFCTIAFFTFKCFFLHFFFTFLV